MSILTTIKVIADREQNLGMNNTTSLFKPFKWREKKNLSGIYLLILYLLYMTVQYDISMSISKNIKVHLNPPSISKFNK